MEAFLNANGFTLEANDAEVVVAILALAAGEIGEEELAAWLRERHAAGATVCSICTGSLVLAEAGLLRFRHPQEVRGVVGPGTALADLYLRVRVNGDVAVLQGIGKALLEREAATNGEEKPDLAEASLAIDAMAALDCQSWGLRLNALNLLDKRYWTTGMFGSIPEFAGRYYADPRRIYVELRFTR